MPTDKEQLGLVLTEWEVSDFRDLLIALQERRQVSQTLTVNNLVLRLAKERAEEIRGSLVPSAGIVPNEVQAKEPEPMNSKPPAPPAKKPADPEAKEPKRRGRPYTGQKVSVTITIDADLVVWLVGLAGEGKPLSPTVNEVLRRTKDLDSGK